MNKWINKWTDYEGVIKKIKEGDVPEISGREKIFLIEWSVYVWGEEMITEDIQDSGSNNWKFYTKKPHRSIEFLELEVKGDTTVQCPHFLDKKTLKSGKLRTLSNWKIELKVSLYCTVQAFLLPVQKYILFIKVGIYNGYTKRRKIGEG